MEPKGRAQKANMRSCFIAIQSQDGAQKVKDRDKVVSTSMLYVTPKNSRVAVLLIFLLLKILNFTFF